MRRGLFPSRHEAQAAIAAGSILVAGAPADKAARLVAPDEPVVVLGPPSPFVSRGGLKLDAALSRFAVPVSGRRALDAGASTGGFTDCLLQRGATHVYAVDVGHGQLHPVLRADPRVTVLEHTNARTLTAAAVTADPAYEACPLVVTDLSFISLRSVVPALAGPVSAPGADLVLLVKPQFEAGRVAVSRGKGVVRDPAVWLGALEGVVSALHDAKTGIMGAMASPLTGAAGNVEFLLHARKGTPGRDADEAAALLSAAVSEAEGTPDHGRPGRRTSRARPMATVTFLVHPDRPTPRRWPPRRPPGCTSGDTWRGVLRFSGPDRVSEAGVAGWTSVP